MKRHLGWVLGVLLVAPPAAAQSRYAVFDDGHDTIGIPGNTVIGSGMTMEARIRFCATMPSPNEFGQVFDEQQSAVEDKALSAGTDGVAGITFRGSPTPFNALVPLSNHVWHHLAFVGNGSVESIYIDGVLAGSRTQGPTVANSAGSAMAVGALRDTDLVVPNDFRPSFRGVLDSIRVSTIARYTGMAFTPPAGDMTSDASTVLLYSFNDGVGNPTAADSSPSGFTGTLGSGAFTAPTSPLITNDAGIAFCMSDTIFRYPFPGVGGLSATGTQWISLPRDIANPVVGNCQDLKAHLGATTLSRYVPATDAFELCSCPGAACFSIVQGQGYVARVPVSSTPQLVGTEDSGPILLDTPAPGTQRSHLISLPFGTQLTNAGDLAASIGGLTAAGGPVVAVERLVTLSDSVETYNGGASPNFAIVPGIAYRVRVDRTVIFRPPWFGGDYCDTPTTCEYHGRAHTAIPQPTPTAQLALNSAGRLVVSQLGTSGNDGVEIEGPGVLPLAFTGHDPWIPLGTTTTQPVAIASTPTGSRIQPRSFAQLSALTLGGASEIFLDISENASNQIVIQPNFNVTGSTNLCYALRNNGAPASPTFSCGHPQTSPVLATDWPVREAFSVLQWAADVSITLPGGSPTTADELWIRPDSPTLTEATEVEKVQLKVTCGSTVGACSSNPGLTTLTIVDDNNADHVPTYVTPTASYPLSVNRAGTGTGSVAAAGVGCTPGTDSGCGIACGSDCSETYAQGTNVTLTASPDSPSQFVSYSGNCSGTNPVVVVAMNQARFCTARFGRFHNLSITIAGSGTGTVNRSPVGTSCGANCGTYEEGTSVTLLPVPGAYSVFSGFSGTGCGGTTVMTAARSCTATFTFVAPTVTSLPGLSTWGRARCCSRCWGH